MYRASTLLVLTVLICSSFSFSGAPEILDRSTSQTVSFKEEVEGSSNANYAPLHQLLIGPKPPLDLFEKGMYGYSKLWENGSISADRPVLSVIDFRKSCNEKRLWVIDLSQRAVLFNTYVAHGENSGEEFAYQFSNRSRSHMSSLGFYVTGETYNGKHGYSLRLDGQEFGFNHKARERAVVMHGADYADQNYINEHGRLGRSYGCPSVPFEFHEEIISTIKDGTCLFIYYPDRNYMLNSNFVSGSAS